MRQAIPNGGGKPAGDAKPPFRLAQQQKAAIGGQAAAVETGCEFLAPDGWRSERLFIFLSARCAAPLSAATALPEDHRFLWLW